MASAGHPPSSSRKSYAFEPDEPSLEDNAAATGGDLLMQPSVASPDRKGAISRGSRAKKDRTEDKMGEVEKSPKKQKLEKEGDLKGLKVSDLLTGNFASVAVPMLEIPGTSPLVYEQPDELLEQVNGKDEFFVDDMEEEFVMFTAEIQDRIIRRQDGPHHTLRWRKKVRLITQKNFRGSVEEALGAIDETLPTQEEEITHGITEQFELASSRNNPL